jgi:hypothetical protein
LDRCQNLAACVEQAERLEEEQFVPDGTNFFSVADDGEAMDNFPDCY